MADEALYPREGQVIVRFADSEMSAPAMVSDVHDHCDSHESMMLGTVVAAPPRSDLKDGDMVLVTEYGAKYGGRIDDNTYLCDDYAIKAVAGRKPGPKPKQ